MESTTQPSPTNIVLSREGRCSSLSQIGKGWPLCDLSTGSLPESCESVTSPSSIRLERMVASRKFIFFYSGSSATLSPWRSGESCLSKDQRETPLTRSTEVNQTPLCVEKSGSLESPGLKPDPD